jgi:hypothetical protein
LDLFDVLNLSTSTPVPFSSRRRGAGDEVLRLMYKSTFFFDKVFFCLILPGEFTKHHNPPGVEVIILKRWI